MSANLATWSPPPPGTNFIAILQPMITFLLPGTILSSFLIPILIAIFAFSTPHSRRQPVFVLNVLGILIGLLQGALLIYLSVHSILSPNVPELRGAAVGYTIATTLGPMMAESTLLLRLITVYPLQTTPKLIFLAILSFPVTIMVIRIINIAFFLHNYISALKGVAISLLAAETLRNSWRIKLEWILQCVNNLFVSFMFLRRLQRYAVSGQGDSGIGKHFRGLFLIALSNFVFPVVLNIIQLSLIFISKSSFSQIALIYLVNNFITIFGVVFATLWISGRHMKEQSSRGAVLPIVSSGFVTVNDRRDTGVFFVASSQTRMSSNNTQTSFANDPYDIGKVNSIGTSSSSVPMEITVNVSTECNSV